MSLYRKITDSEAIYVDANVLIKIDAKQEPGSDFARILLYGSKIPVFCSYVGFGEFIGVINKRKIQKSIGVEGYLFFCRQLMNDFNIGKIQRAEPPEDKIAFLSLEKELLNKYKKLGGGDIWHLMAALNLKNRFPKTVFVSFEKNKIVSAAGNEGLSAVGANGLKPEPLITEFKRNNKWIGQ